MLWMHLFLAFLPSSSGISNWAAFPDVAIFRIFPSVLWMLLFLAFLPSASAIPNGAAFPDMTFRAFNLLVEDNFGSNISLATVIMVLFTLTNNPELLSLHARQQNPAVKGEKRFEVTAWIKALANALHDRLGDDIYTLQRDDETDAKSSDTTLTNSVGRKLDQFSKDIGLYPYTVIPEESFKENWKLYHMLRFSLSL
jgi:hypothetical protein